VTSTPAVTVSLRCASRLLAGIRNRSPPEAFRDNAFDIRLAREDDSRAKTKRRSVAHRRRSGVCLSGMLFAPVLRFQTALSDLVARSPETIDSASPLSGVGP